MNQAATIVLVIQVFVELNANEKILVRRYNSQIKHIQIFSQNMDIFAKFVVQQNTSKFAIFYTYEKSK